MTGVAGRLVPAALALAMAPAGVLAILLAHRTHPVVPLVLVGGAGALVLAYARPLAGVLLAIALIPLEVFAIPLGAIVLSPTELMFAVTGVLWAVRRIVEGNRPWAASPLSRPLLALWLAGIPSLAVAVDPGSVVRFLIIWGALLLVFALIVSEAGAREVRTLLFALALVGAVVGVVAVATAGQQELSASGTQASGRAVGAFGSPNILATFLAMTLPAALFVAFAEARRRRPVALFAAGVITAGLALTLSRGGMLAAAGALLVMLGWAPLRRLALAAAVALLAVTLLNANPLGDVQQVQVVLERVESVRYQSSNRTDQRTRIYSETPRLIADFWATGVGPTNFPNVAPRYGIIEPYSNDTFLHAHNLGLAIAADFGILGVIALVWVLAGIARAIPRACRRGSPSRGAGFAVTAALVALGLQGLVDFTLYSNVIAALMFVFLALLVVLAREAPAEPAAATPA